MAWATSADPGETLAHGNGAALGEANRSLGLALLNVSERPIALAAIAHAAGLAIVLPFAADNPILIVPVLIGLAAIYVTLPRNADVRPVNPIRNCQHGSTPGPTLRDGTEPGAVTAISAVPLTATEVSDDVRSELMARVSHELRTPLNAVMGFSDLMGHQLFGPLGHPRYEEYVSHIRESSQRLLKSAEDTLAITSLMAKSSSGTERERVGLLDTVREAKSQFASDAGRTGISYQLKILDELEVFAHRRGLRQALVNILSEAHQRAADGATLSLSASADLDKVAFSVSVDMPSPRSQEEHRSLPICIARTLLELDGGRLYDHSGQCTSWSVTISLDRANQGDFFG